MYGFFQFKTDKNTDNLTNSEIEWSEELSIYILHLFINLPTPSPLFPKTVCSLKTLILNRAQTLQQGLSLKTNLDKGK